jgi:hypothetical protein
MTMAVTDKRLRALLKRCGMPYDSYPDGAYGLTIDCSAEPYTYRNPEGGAELLVVISREAGGRGLTVCAPIAYMADQGRNLDAVREACLCIQSQSCGLRFSVDESGEVSPQVDLVLDDAKPTATLVARLLGIVVRGVVRFDGVIRRAIETGVVSFDGVPPPDESDPAEALRTRLHRMLVHAGGLDRLEAIATGGPDSPALDARMARLAYDRIIGVSE